MGMRDFYFRCLRGHKTKKEIEIEEIEINREGIIKYFNFSTYSGTNSFKRSIKLSDRFLVLFIEFIKLKNILIENDKLWPKDTDDTGFQEIEIYINKYHLSFRIPKHISIKRYLINDNYLGLKKVLELLESVRFFVIYLFTLHFKTEQKEPFNFNKN